MNRRSIGVIVVVAGLALGACGSDAAEPDDADSATAPITRLWVKPELVDCVGEMEQKCMQVAEAEDGEYLYFYDQIDGFDFVEGTGYVIDVRIEEVDDPPADGSSLAYTLVEVVDQS